MVMIDIIITAYSWARDYAWFMLKWIGCLIQSLILKLNISEFLFKDVSI